MFCNWASEIGPDFWTFCCCGTAHALTIKEILSLPSKYVFKVSKFDPHPPPFLRVLLAFEWCRQMWGNGKWDNWQREWIEFYPMHMAPERSWRIFEIGRDLLKIISKILFTAKFSSLNWKSIPSLFDFKSIDPKRIDQIASSVEYGQSSMKEESPEIQLCIYREIWNRGKYTEIEMDRIMTKWLLNLGQQKKSRLRLYPLRQVQNKNLLDRL